MATREFDIVVWGATGFTGSLVAEYLSKNANHFKWAIAGRSHEKLEKVVEHLEELGDGLSPHGIITASCEDTKSMRDMCARTKVLAACVGPFRFYGEAAIEACVHEGAKYVDVNGEPEFFERMALEYDVKAKEAAIPLVICAGMDSIPGDMGTQLILEDAKQEGMDDVRQVECIISVPKGQAVNMGTWVSLVNSFANVHQLRKLRGQKQKQPQKKKMEWISSPLHQYVVPMPVADAAVVRMSKKLGVVPPEVKYMHKMALRKWWHVLYLMILFFVLRVFAPKRWGRRLLLRHPFPPFSSMQRSEVGVHHQPGRAWFSAENIDGRKIWREFVFGDVYWFTATGVGEAAMYLVEHDDVRSGLVTPAASLGLRFMHERMLKDGTECAWNHV